MRFLKALCKSRLPQINYYYLQYVPEDSEEVRDFMRNSIPTQNQFYFNISKLFQIEASKYIEELKLVASKTLTHFYVYYTNFSLNEFCELIPAVKNVKYLYLNSDLIPLDEECNFCDNMNNCKINFISLTYSGGIKFSNWSEYPRRFEHLIDAIAKCKPLTKSFKYFQIYYCDLVKAKVQEIFNKYKLNKVVIDAFP